jgi:hypothetical protein
LTRASQDAMYKYPISPWCNLRFGQIAQIKAETKDLHAVFGQIAQKGAFTRAAIRGIPMTKGTLAMLLPRVLQSGRLHGYAIAQRIRELSGEVLEAEEGSLYPALQRILMEGWAAAHWGKSDTGRSVRFYRQTPEGVKRLSSSAAATSGPPRSFRPFCVRPE